MVGALILASCGTATETSVQPNDASASTSSRPSAPGTSVLATTATVPAAVNGAIVGSRPGTEPDGQPGSVDTLVGDADDHVVFIGDSVLVSVVDDVARRLRSTMHVDTADCRRLDQDVTGPCGNVPAGVIVHDGVEAVETIVSSLAVDGIVPDAAVVVLANNSSITDDLLDEVMALTVGIDHVWWVNTRIDGFGRQDSNNRLLDDLTAADDRAGLVDWYSASRGQPWLRDNVHPNDIGQVELADLIVDRLHCACPTGGRS